MKNRISMNVDQVAGLLVKSGVPIRGIFKTEEPEVEDDMVRVSDTIHVQVSSYGDCWMHVVRQDGDDYVFYPERLTIAELVADINKAKADE